MPFSALKIQEMRYPKQVVTNTRAMLSIVPDREQFKREWSGVIVITIILIVGGVISSILLNTAVAKNQYEIVRLTQEANALRQDNENRNSEINYLKSPQVLHQKANDLGMVAGTTSSVINLADGSVTKFESNSSNQRVETSLPLPKKPKEYQKMVKEKQKPKSEAVEKPTTAISEKPTTLIAPTVINAGDERPASWDDKVLNGGTIPAPVQKAPEE